MLTVCSEMCSHDSSHITATTNCFHSALGQNMQWGWGKIERKRSLGERLRVYTAFNKIWILMSLGTTGVQVLMTSVGTMGVTFPKVRVRQSVNSVNSIQLKNLMTSASILTLCFHRNLACSPVANQKKSCTWQRTKLFTGHFHYAFQWCFSYRVKTTLMNVEHWNQRILKKPLFF